MRARELRRQVVHPLRPAPIRLPFQQHANQSLEAPLARQVAGNFGQTKMPAHLVLCREVVGALPLL
eukprot:4892090-Alexandrium_andersonii.AAC.1